MIIFLYGPDDYRREAKKREIVAEFQKKRSDLGLMAFDFLNEGELPDGGERFKEFLANQSLFQTAKMAVVSGLFETIDSSFTKTPAGKDFINILKGVLENKNITVLISEKDKPVRALDFLLKKPVVVQEFEVLRGKEWEGFMRTEIKKREINISPDGARFLAQVYEGDTWRLITELDKIQFLGGGEIQIKNLEDLGVAQAPNFWGLILGFKSRDVAARLWALEKVFGTNDPPAKIFNILAYQLPDKLQMLANYDLMVKSGKIEYEEALLDLVIG